MQVYRVDLLSFFAKIEIEFKFIYSRIPTFSTALMIYIYDFKRPHLIIKIAILTSSIIGEYKKIYLRNIFFLKAIFLYKRKPADISTPYCVYSRLFSTKSPFLI